MKRSNLAAVFLVSLVVVLVAILAVGCTGARPTGQPAMQPAATREAVPEGISETSEPAATSLPESTPSTAPLPDAGESASAETVPVQPGIVGIAAKLAGLPLDDFYEESYNQLLLRDPQRLTGMQLSEAFGLRNDQLTNISDAYLRETQELEAAILHLLRSYDRAALTAEQQISYDVYEWYLDSLVRGHEFMYYGYPLHHFLGSYQFNLDQLFTEYHLLADRQDVEDYISRLSQVDDQVEQLMEGLALRDKAGLTPPRFIVELTISDLMAYLQMSSPDPAAIDAELLPVYTVLREGVQKLDDLSASEKQAFLDAALTEIEESFIPAYVQLLDYLDQLANIAGDEAGLCRFPSGDDYYAYLLRRETSTDLTPAEIHEIGLAEVARIQGEIREAFAELGYPQDESLGELMERAVYDGGLINISSQNGKDEYVGAVEALIARADQRTEAAFDLRPTREVVVVGGATGGYYVPGASDGSRPGAYHVNLLGTWRPRYSMPTIAYHEAIPGHHLQIAIAQDLELPRFRNEVVLNAYAEGWALYAERLAWELGLYEDDPYGNIGRLQLELLRAVRLVADTGIHDLCWTREQARAYLSDALGDPAGHWSHEVDRYVVMPAQATGYKIGMLKMLELRQRAMDELGDRFELKEFHNVVLGNGSVPLGILERVVQDYIDTELGRTPAAGDGVVLGWAVLAEKDDYDDVDMTNLPVNHIGITQMRQVLVDSGWNPDQIRDLREFDSQALEQGLDWLAEQADQDDIVIVYVAAHGRYLRDVLNWGGFFPPEWAQIPSHRRLLVIDSCQAANYTGAVSADTAPYLAIASVAGDEYGWSGLEEEGLPIIGGVFTHYFAAAFGYPDADADADGLVSVQEAAMMAEDQQRAYMHDVVFAVPEFLEMYHGAGAFPDQDPAFPHVVVDDTLGEPLFLTLDAYP